MKKIGILLLSILCGYVTHAQDYNEYLDAAQKYLLGGNYEKAEAAYNVYKKMTGIAISKFENIGLSKVIKQTGYIDMGFPSGTKWNSQNESKRYSFDEALKTYSLSVLPSSKQWQELSDYCNWKWYELNGIYGYILTSKFNGNSIFLPADIPFWEFHVKDTRFENEESAISLELYYDGAFFRGAVVSRSKQLSVRLVSVSSTRQ